MKTFTFVIASADDFESIDELMDYVSQAGRNGTANYSCHEFEAPKDCDEETVTMIGRGIAFSNDWCMDHTFSYLVHGTIDNTTKKLQSETQRHDLWEIK
jgi:hypothetical protein